MAKDILKKDAGRNSAPPDSAPVPGLEGAYGHKGEVTTSNDVAFETFERPAAPGGILKDQPGEYGRNYPGRPTPPAQAVVTEAKCVPGTAKKCSDSQNSSNRNEMNERVRQEGQP